MQRVFRVNKKKVLDVTWEEAFSLFLTWKQAEGIARRTLDDYEEHIKRFFTCYPDAYSDPETLKRRVLEYMAQPVAPATFNLRRAYLKSFFAWCVREGSSLKTLWKAYDERKTLARYGTCGATETFKTT